MNYFYNPAIDVSEPCLEEEESRHCVRVLRYKQGQTIYVLDGNGNLYEGQLADPNPKKASFNIQKITRKERREYFIHLAVSPTKNMDRLEWMVEKATEIGIDQLSFVLCDNSERKVLKTERLIKKGISAMKQSGNFYLPYIGELQSFSKFINSLSFTGDKYIAHADKGLRNSLITSAKKGKEYLVLVGPEGDFSPNEIEMALEHNFIPISLGQNRLRTETAGLVVCAQLNALNSQHG